MKAKPFLIAAFAAAVLVFAAWIVETRTKGLDMADFKPLSGTPTGSGTSTNASGLPVLANSMPEFSGIAAWLNSTPLTPADLKGKVVLVDFWTYSCINCIRTLPYTTSWYGKYKDKGFVVIGVHTPEFAFEKVQSNVEAAMKQFGIAYPVALDNDYGTWNNYSNEYWPAEYLFDAQGRLRHYQFGEGKYDETEKAIQDLLKEAGEQAQMPTEPVVVPDFQKIASPETYLGYKRQEYLGSPEPVMRDAAGTYSAPATPVLNQFYFVGKWQVGDERAMPLESGAKIVYKYPANKVNLVMGPLAGKSGKVRVMIDGKTAGEIVVDTDRLYQLYDDGGQYGEHVLELIFEDTNLAGYAFTFG